VAKPNKKLPVDLQSLARSYTKRTIEILGGIAENSEQDAARVSACAQLLDRGWGKAAQPLTGKGGDDDIRVTIRTIIEGKK
jgi:hypothetical protein